MKVPEIIRQVARNLRNNMTQSELILWNSIKNKNLWYKFLRQKPILLFTEYSWFNRYIIPDFYCFEKKIIIEVDWSIHNLKEIYALDLEKEKLLKKLWIKVIRIKNEEIKNNLSNMLFKIKDEMKKI